MVFSPAAAEQSRKEPTAPPERPTGGGPGYEIVIKAGQTERQYWRDLWRYRELLFLLAYRDIGFAGVLRPDHVPTVEGDGNNAAGYSAYGRLYAIGYIRGLQETVYAETR